MIFMVFSRTGRYCFASLVTLAIGCHSVPLKSPVDPHLEINSKWLKDYKEAQSSQTSDPKRSCDLFRALGADDAFPAKELAKLRAVEICEKSSLDRESLPPYLQNIGLDIALKLASSSGDKAAEMDLAAEKSKQKLPQNEKLKWIELALQRAREINADKQTEVLLKRQYSIAPRLNPSPSERQFLAVANDLRMTRKFEQARQYYEKVITSPHFLLDDKISALKGIRLSYKNARQDDAHIKTSQRLVNYLHKAEKLNPKSSAVRAASYDAQTYYGRALWTLGRSEEARKVFLDIEKKMKNKISLAELYWLLGRMAEEKGHAEEVGRYMEMALKERLSNQELRDKILWYTAWNERRQKNLARSAEVLKDLEANTQSEFTRNRTLYWLGKTYSELNKPDDSRQTLEKLIQIDPLGYFGLLAQRDLGLNISFRRSSSSAENGDPALPLDVTLAEWLALLDEKDALDELLSSAATAYRKQKTQTDEGWTALLRQYAKGGLYGKLYEVLSSLEPDRRKNISEAHPELLFPQPWTDDVKMAALQFNVDEELIYAIMRQESAFDPRARSGADAFGLMQVIPEIAEHTASSKKISYAHMDDLYEPKVNIPIGAAHLRELLDRHKGQFIPAVASYNASEKAISNWIRTRYRGDALEFIEEIPYEETRAYVRLVMRNMIFYRLLKSKSASIEFPAWVLKLDPS